MEKSEWLIAWSDALSVGIPAMDDEHREFILRVNELNSAVERSMNLMLAQAADHFRHEEELLDQLNFPQAVAHKARHDELTAQFGRVMQEFKETDVSYVWALKGLRMKQLLVEHLLQEDMKYRDFARAQRTPK
jgi:hemerythrin